MVTGRFTIPIPSPPLHSSLDPGPPLPAMPLRSALCNSFHCFNDLSDASRGHAAGKNLLQSLTKVLFWGTCCVHHSRCTKICLDGRAELIQYTHAATFYIHQVCHRSITALTRLDNNGLLNVAVVQNQLSTAGKVSDGHSDG